MTELAAAGVAVPPVIGHDTSADRPWFVMPWYDGGSLDDLLAARPTIEAVLDLLASIAVSLASIHQLGYSHRDLKPANILLSDNGPLIADFGLCRSDFDDRLTKSWEAVGSRYFIAPENESGVNEEVDQKPADAYAFGKIAWRLISGRKPLARELHLMASHQLRNIVDPRLAGLDELLARLGNIDPRARLSDWAVILNEIETQRRLLMIDEAAITGRASAGLQSRQRVLALLREIESSGEVAAARALEVERKRQADAIDRLRVEATQKFADWFNQFSDALSTISPGFRVSSSGGGGTTLSGALRANAVPADLWDPELGGNSWGSVVASNYTGAGITGELWVSIYPVISGTREFRLVRVLHLINRTTRNGEGAFINTESGSFPALTDRHGIVGLPSAYTLIDEFLEESADLVCRAVELFVESICGR